MVEKVSGGKALESLAEKLKHARMVKNLSLDDVSRLITVQKNYLEKIEECDFSFLPKPYIMTFVKEYALLMGVGNDDDFEQCKKELQIPVALHRDISVDHDSQKTAILPGGAAILKQIRIPGYVMSLGIGIVLIGIVGFVAFSFGGKVQISPFHPPVAASVPSASTEDTVAVAEQIVDSSVLNETNKPEPIVAPVSQEHPVTVPVDSAKATPSKIAASVPVPHLDKKPISSKITSHPESGSKEWAKNVSFRPTSPSSPYKKVLVVRLVEDYSWVKVIADDSARVYPGGQFKNGQVLRYEARKKFWVNIGRPKYVELYINGKKLSPFTDRILILN